MTIRSAIETLLLMSFILMPIAHRKLEVFGLPLYAMEIPIALAALAFAYSLWKKHLLAALAPLNGHVILVGLFLFLAGTLLSLFSNPLSLTSLGLWKSWVCFPLLAAFLFIAIRGDIHKLFLVWFASSSAIAFGALIYLSLGILTYDGRLEAWYASPNFLAALLAPGILIGITMLNTLLSDKRSSFPGVAAISLSLIALGIALFFTRSYGAWAATIIALGSSTLLATRSKKRLAIAALLMLSVASLFAYSEYGSEKWQSLTGLHERSSLASRLMIWQSAARIIADHPLTGIGLGRFQEEYLSYQQYFPPYLEWAVPEPHNLALALWVNTGLFGLIGFIIITGCAFVISIRNKKTGAWPVLPILIFFLLYGIFDTPYFGNDLSFLFSMLIAAALRDRSDTGDASADR